MSCMLIFFFKQKTAYELRISDWSSDVCSSDLVVAVKLEADNSHILFNYGKSYLERVHDFVPSIPIYEPELPLHAGVLPLMKGLSMPSCIRDEIGRASCRERA